MYNTLASTHNAKLSSRTGQQCQYFIVASYLCKLYNREVVGILETSLMSGKPRSSGSTYRNACISIVF